MPVPAAAAVLAHRQGLTNAALRVWLLGGEGGLGALMSLDSDEEARAAAAGLRQFRADPDPATNAHRHLILAEPPACSCANPPSAARPGPDPWSRRSLRLHDSM